MGQFSISVLQQLSTDFWIFVSLPSRFRLSSTASDAAPRHTSFFLLSPHTCPHRADRRGWTPQRYAANPPPHPAVAPPVVIRHPRRLSAEGRLITDVKVGVVRIRLEQAFLGQLGLNHEGDAPRGGVVDLLHAPDVYPFIALESGEIRILVKVVGYVLSRAMTCCKPQKDATSTADLER